MTASRLRICSFLGAPLLAACAGDLPDDPAVGGGARPLIGGQVTGDDPAVVALAVAAGVEPFCTGTLISPRVVLTAAHCVDMFSGQLSFDVYIGADAAAEGIHLAADVKVQHPDWQGGIGLYDIALVRLESPADPSIPVDLNDVAPLDQLIGAAYRQVGFGRHDRDSPVADGKKRQGTTTITGYLADSDVILSGDDDLAVCFGDSGGPGFITVDGAELLAGIHSFTSSDCRAPSGDTRVDLYVDDFIRPWVQENDPSCGEDLLCARIGCTGDPDCEPCGPDGGCTADCALPDPDCPTSAVGDICRADSQCASDLCVFWRGDTAYRFCSQPCDPSAPDCPSGMSCQSVQLFGSICYFDDDPPGVLGDDCEEPTDCGSYLCDEGACVFECDLSAGFQCPDQFECRSLDGEDYFCRRIADEDGGCAVDHSASSALALALTVLLGAIFTRRRRRPLP